MSVDIDNPWEVDDLSRRVFLYLFDNTPPEKEQNLRRMRRRFLTELMTAAIHGNHDVIYDSARGLYDSFPSPRPVVVAPLATDPAYSTDATEPSAAQVPQMVSL